MDVGSLHSQSCSGFLDKIAPNVFGHDGRKNCVRSWLDRLNITVASKTTTLKEEFVASLKKDWLAETKNITDNDLLTLSERKQVVKSESTYRKSFFVTDQRFSS